MNELTTLSSTTLTEGAVADPAEPNTSEQILVVQWKLQVVLNDDKYHQHIVHHVLNVSIPHHLINCMHFSKCIEVFGTFAPRTSEAS